MSDEIADAEKAWRTLHPNVARSPIFDKGYAAGRASRDAEVAELREQLAEALAEARSQEDGFARQTVARARAEMERDEAEATIEKARAIVEESSQGDSFYPVYEALSGSSSTGGTDHE